MSHLNQGNAPCDTGCPRSQLGLKVCAALKDVLKHVYKPAVGQGRAGPWTGKQVLWPTVCWLLKALDHQYVSQRVARITIGGLLCGIEIELRI